MPVVDSWQGDVVNVIEAAQPVPPAPSPKAGFPMAVVVGGAAVVGAIALALKKRRKP